MNLLNCKCAKQTMNSRKYLKYLSDRKELVNWSTSLSNVLTLTLRMGFRINRCCYALHTLIQYALKLLIGVFHIWKFSFSILHAWMVNRHCVAFMYLPCNSEGCMSILKFHERTKFARVERWNSVYAGRIHEYR